MGPYYGSNYINHSVDWWLCIKQFDTCQQMTVGGAFRTRVVKMIMPINCQTANSSIILISRFFHNCAVLTLFTIDIFSNCFCFISEIQPWPQLSLDFSGKVNQQNRFTNIFFTKQIIHRRFKWNTYNI